MTVRRQCAAEQMPLFLTVARLAQEKNIRFLLESVATFKIRYQKPFRLVMVGDGPDRMQYEKACEELQIKEQDITPEAELSADLGINSIELANLVMLCEEKFGVTIEDEDIHKFITVGDVVAYLEANGHL